MISSGGRNYYSSFLERFARWCSGGFQPPWVLMLTAAGSHCYERSKTTLKDLFFLGVVGISLGLHFRNFVLQAA
jgi:hypothetical protein